MGKLTQIESEMSQLRLQCGFISRCDLKNVDVLKRHIDRLSRLVELQTKQDQELKESIEKYQTLEIMMEELEN